MQGGDLGAGDGAPRPRGTTAALADRVATLSASATGADGAITVTVASSGNVTGLDLDDRALGLGAPGLAGEILRTMRRAQSSLADEVETAVAETVGADTETGKAILDGFTQRFPADEPREPAAPVMPSPPPFPSFTTTPTLPHQAPGNGYESGRDSRAR
ncbi:YbaB/EbfC family nucleoid-associated protein [Actinoplanes sp. NPDC051851]|uniref:YbaB/EbfC family nucleoid-associated protein n=1 Tax=Actinoplanes sp. NPDC051851 TaxID=3154753 RepID=UPI003414E83F